MSSALATIGSRILEMLLIHLSLPSSKCSALQHIKDWKTFLMLTVESGGLPSMGSQRVRHDWSDLAAAAAAAAANEKAMAPHSSILTWKIPRTEKPGGLQSIGSQRVRHDLTTK